MTKKILSVSALALMVGALSISEASALTVKVQNYTNKRMYLFFRPTHSTSKAQPYTVVVPPTPKGKHNTIKFNASKHGINGYYDVIAAESDGDPDWKLLGGTCKELHKDLTPHILIESPGLGLKTSCTTYGK